MPEHETQLHCGHSVKNTNNGKDLKINPTPGISYSFYFK
jgi:hypothetical protein